MLKKRNYLRTFQCQDYCAYLRFVLRRNRTVKARTIWLNVERGSSQYYKQSNRRKLYGRGRRRKAGKWHPGFQTSGLCRLDHKRWDRRGRASAANSHKFGKTHSVLRANVRNMKMPKTPATFLQCFLFHEDETTAQHDACLCGHFAPE